MNYVILAAGIGSRLYPYTKNFPKCLVNISENESILERCIRMIRKYDKASNIIVVTGFQKEKVIEKSKSCIHIHNPFYRVTNSIASLWFTKNEVLKSKEDLVIINADIVFDDALAEIICSKPKKSSIFYDSSIKSVGDYNVRVCDSKIVVMGKELTEYDGEYAGISKIKNSDIKTTFEQIDDLVDNDLYDQWYENALVQLILNHKLDFYAQDISEHQWSEIDSINNLFKIKRIVTGI